MYQSLHTKIIDLTPYLPEPYSPPNKIRRQELAYSLLALGSQYLSLGALVLYGLLRAALCPNVPLGSYCCPLAALWPASFLLLVTSYVSDKLLWTGDSPRG